MGLPSRSPRTAERKDASFRMISWCPCQRNFSIPVQGTWILTMEKDGMSPLCIYAYVYVWIYWDIFIHQKVTLHSENSPHYTWTRRINYLITLGPFCQGWTSYFLDQSDFQKGNILIKLLLEEMAQINKYIEHIDQKKMILLPLWQVSVANGFKKPSTLRGDHQW